MIILIILSVLLFCLLVLIILLNLIGHIRWRRSVSHYGGELERAGSSRSTTAYSQEQIKDLPEVVRNYFQAV